MRIYALILIVVALVWSLTFAVTMLIQVGTQIRV
jgi:hypothetical protein